MTPRARRLLGRTILVLLPIVLVWATLELVVFDRVLHALPPRLTGLVPADVRPLAQSAKRATIPRRYVAVVGDSWAVGFGDWLLDAFGDWRPVFQATHLAHARTGRDFVSFAGPGVGTNVALQSFQGGFRDLARWKRFDLEQPEQILVYLYEGNDLDDDVRAHARQGPATAWDFRSFPRKDDRGPFDGLFVARFFGAAIASLFTKQPPLVGLDVPKTDPPPGTIQGEHPGSPYTAIITGRAVGMPDNIQGPAMELTDDELANVFGALEKSLAAVKKMFPKSKMTLVYLPSLWSTYRITSKEIGVEEFHGRGRTFPGDAVWPRSDLLAGRAKAVTDRLGIGFHDTRPTLRKAAEGGFIHGPRDWQHLNRLGYEALAEDLVRLVGP